MKNLVRNPLFYLTVVLTVFVSWAGIGFVTAQQWQAPTQSFPNQGDIGEPINTGSAAQTKTGPLALQGQLTINTGTGNAGLRMEGGSTMCLPDEVNGAIVCKQAWSQIGAPAGTGSQWTSSGNDIYYTSGKVGIGTNTPQVQLEIQGDMKVSPIYEQTTEPGPTSFTYEKTETVYRRYEWPRMSCDSNNQDEDCTPGDTGATASSPSLAYDQFLENLCPPPERSGPCQEFPSSREWRKVEHQDSIVVNKPKNGGLSVAGMTQLGQNVFVTPLTNSLEIEELFKSWPGISVSLDWPITPGGYVISSNTTTPPPHSRGILFAEKKISAPEIYAKKAQVSILQIKEHSAPFGLNSGDRTCGSGTAGSIYSDVNGNLFVCNSTGGDLNFSWRKILLESDRNN